MSKQQELTSLLIANKLITPEQAIEINNLAGHKDNNFEDKLVAKGVNLEKLVKLKAKVYNLKYENLTDKKISDLALNIIPLEVAENYKIICFAKEDNKIKVGLIDPNNFKAIEAVDFLAKEEALLVEYYLISITSFNHASKYYKTLGKEVSTALKTKAAEEVEEVKKKKEAELEEITKIAPISKIVSVIIRHAVEGRASDIHIEPLPRESRVRYRIDGVLHTSLILPKNIHAAIVARIKVLANLKLDETRMPQDGRIRLTINDREVDLRISVLPLIDQEKVVMRILDVSQGAPTLEDLGFMGLSLEVIKENMKKTDGMLLVTGPTGSGKSTTLFSVLKDMNQEGVNIVTLEDPVEYFIKGVNQSQIRPEIGFTFASGLRSLLRQDPNIIMVGEIRDNETAELAIHASLTGHFVLSTLHTNDAIGAIPRLLDMNVEPYLLASTLNVVIAQRLARKICLACKAEYKLPEEILTVIKNEITKLPPDMIEGLLPNFDANKLVFYKGKGCFRCGNSGYVSRIALVEVINVTDELKKEITSTKKLITPEDIRNTQTFITMKQDGIIKVIKGLTTIEEVLRTVHVTSEISPLRLGQLNQ